MKQWNKLIMQTTRPVSRPKEIDPSAQARKQQLYVALAILVVAAILMSVVLHVDNLIASHR